MGETFHVGGEALRLRVEVSRADQHLGGAVGHDVGQGVVVRAGGRRRDGRAGAERAEHGLDEPVIVLHQDGDVIATADAERLEAVGDLVGAILERDVGNPVIAVDESFLLRPNTERQLEDISEIHGLPASGIITRDHHTQWPFGISRPGAP